MVETNGKVLVDFVKSIAGDGYLCLEEGAQSEWLYEVLEPHVKELLVVRAQRRLGGKSDSSDAWNLADGYRTGQLGGPLQGAEDVHRSTAGGAWISGSDARCGAREAAPEGDVPRSGHRRTRRAAGNCRCTRHRH
jgi:hypothetical protein